jgi:hypothetical protein
MSNENHTHAIMFHHFHDLGDAVGQGSISSYELYKMIDWLKQRYNLLSAIDYSIRLANGTLRERDICLSFDDALLCQKEIAVPILDEFDVQAFFFVYSSPFVGHPDPLEVYRYFRTTEFPEIDHFYREFSSLLQSLYSDSLDSARRDFDSVSYLSAFPFYSENDKWFRFLRDQVLAKEEYDEVMNILMKAHSFDRHAAYKRLWMSESDLKSLADSGHVVGLHSYTHPTTIHKMAIEEQEWEYVRNFEHLHSVIGEKPFAMAHPCGNYSHETLLILRRLGIKIGFRCNTTVKTVRSALEIPREDHANIMKKMMI